MAYAGDAVILVDGNFLKRLNVLYQSRNAIGTSWGLPHKAIRWIYLAIVRPVITCGWFVWCCAFDKFSTENLS